MRKRRILFCKIYDINSSSDLWNTILIKYNRKNRITRLKTAYRTHNGTCSRIFITDRKESSNHFSGIHLVEKTCICRNNFWSRSKARTSVLRTSIHSWTYIFVIRYTICISICQGKNHTRKCEKEKEELFHIFMIAYVSA